MKKRSSNKFSISDIIYSHKFLSISNMAISNTTLLKKQEENYLNILLAIENIPPCFTSTKNNIKDKVDKYIKSIDEIDYYKNEKFYKAGFNDGYNYLLELEKQERIDNK